jgi:multiple sugar transport system substrate-binding protein
MMWSGFTRKGRLAVAAALTVALALAVGACGGSGNDGGGGDTGANIQKAAAGSAAYKKFTDGLKKKYAGKDLRIISIADPFIPAFKKTAAEFAKLTGAKVTTDTFGYDAIYEKEVLACNQGSSTYDVIVFDVPWTEAFVDCTEHLDGRLKKADPELIKYDDFFPVMREATQWKGKTIGVPFAPYFVLQHYNTKYYDALGLKPAKTFDEFVANAKASNKSKKFPNVYGTALNNQAGSAVGQMFFEYIYNFPDGKPFASMYPGSKEPYSDMTPLFSSPQGIKTVELFKRMLAYEPPGALNSDWTKRQSYFNTGKIASVNQWDVTTPSASDPKQSTVADSHATAPFPADGKLVTQVGGWSMGLNKNSDTAQKDIAWDFTQWFTTAETSVAFSKAGGFPARQSALENPELNKQYPWYATLKEVIPTAFADCRPRIKESFDIINTLGTHISKALAGDVSTEEAMKAADEEIGAMLKKAGYTVKS